MRDGDEVLFSLRSCDVTAAVHKSRLLAGELPPARRGTRQTSVASRGDTHSWLTPPGLVHQGLGPPCWKSSVVTEKFSNFPVGVYGQGEFPLQIFK